MNIVLVLLVSYVEISLAHERTLKLSIDQNDGTLNGLGCAIDDPLNQSGGKFDTLTRRCTKLLKNWFLYPTFEAGNNYFRLTRLGGLGTRKETYFEERVPPISVPGGAVVLSVKSTSSPKTGWTAVHFKDNDDKTIMVQLIESNKLCFDAAIGAKVCTSNPISEPEIAYKLEYSFTSSSVQVFTNDSLTYTFDHRFDVTSYQRLRVTYSNKMSVFVCSWMAFRY